MPAIAIAAAETELASLLPSEIQELDDIMKSYNELIMDPLRDHFNYRQNYKKRIEQLFLQYRVVQETERVRVDIYLTTHDKLLMQDWNVVKDKPGVFNTSAIRNDLRQFMVKLMKTGLSTTIRRAKKLPEELI